MAAAKKMEALGPAARGAAIVGLHLVGGLVPVYYAAQINFSSAASQGPDWANFAFVSTILTAILFETTVLLFMRRMFVLAFAALALIAPFFAINMLTASGNVASADTHARDLRIAQAQTAEALKDRRLDAVKHRDAATALAASETERSALNKIERTKAEHSTTWNDSRGCDPAFITLPLTKQVCGETSPLKVKAAAAVEYEKARAEIDAIDAKSWDLGIIAAQSTGAGAGAAVVAFATRLGYDLSLEDGERAFEWGRGGCFSGRRKPKHRGSARRVRPKA